MLQTKLHSLDAITKKLTWRNIRKNLTTPESKKAITLYGSQIVGLGCAFAAQKLNTKFLHSPEEYGIITASIAIFTVVYTFFDFGVFPAAARVLARAKNEEDMRAVWGTLFIVVFAIGAVFTILIELFFLVYGAAGFTTPIAHAMTFASLFAWVYTLQFFFQDAIPGSQKMYHLSGYNILAKFLYALLLGGAILLFRIDAVTSLLLNLISMGISGVTVAFFLRPIFKGWRRRLPELISEVKEYGRHVYFGRVIASPAFNLAGAVLPYLGGTTSSALFAVGGNLTTPMVQASQAISSTLFRNFTSQQKIKTRLIFINAGVLIIIGLLLYFGAPILIRITANARYFGAIPLMFPLVLAGFFQGFYQPFNLFVSAHGQGRWLNQIAIASTIFDVTSCLTLIPLFGLWGACWQSVASRAFWLILCLYNYHRTVRLLALGNMNNPKLTAK